MDNKLPKGLYALLDDGLFKGRNPVSLARAAVNGGAGVVQLRLEHTVDREALAIARAVRAVAPTLIINDRVDLALLVEAGVHLGAEDLPVAQARRVLGPRALIGATCRNLHDIEAAAREGADHVGVGPIFLSSTKTLPHPLLGAEGLEAIALNSPLPIVAISGINLDNITSVARAGAHCAAVASGLFAAADVEVRAKMLSDAFRR